MIRVVIADDHHLVRQGIHMLLEREGDIEVVGEAADGREALHLVERLSPDVLVIDIAMPRMDGIQALGHVSDLDVPTQVVILSMYSDVILVRRALRAGARGYLLKHSVMEELLLAVRAASRREVYLSPVVSQLLVDDFVEGTDPDRSYYDLLTPREREILQLIAEGHTNYAIADLLSVSIKTVEKHRSNLMSKLKVHDAASLIQVAIKHALIFIDPS